MARRATLRASDTDREQVTQRLQEATTEGRLAPEELEQRVEGALSARTYGELDAVLVDLPGAGRTFRSRARRERGELAWVRRALVAAVAVPVALVLTVALVFAVTGIFAVWGLWLAAGWFFFSRRRRRYARGYLGFRGCAHARGGPARVQSSRGSWV
jgi:hypothetical protein